MLKFAIGDIHGHLDRLNRVLETCARYADGRPSKRILLGDYVDRGPDSKGVVERVMQLTASGDIALYGNHEAMLLAALSDKDEDVRFFIDYGGMATLNSYGISEKIDVRPIPKAHTDWMRRLPRWHDDGLRFYCHAGIDHTLPLDEQPERILVWTKHLVPPWADLPRLIVHGHTPVEGGFPDLRRSSVNVDTGCCFGGPLSAAVFDDVHKMPIAFVVDDEVTELPIERP
jgi:serine/threonine protein phosphatase 1